MKRMMMMVWAILLTLPTFAGWRNTMLRIREERGRTISVTIDGRKYNKINRTLTIGDLPAGLHQIKVFAYNTNGHGYRNGLLIYQGQIRTNPGKIYYCTVFDNTLDIEENCCIDDYGRWNDNPNWDTWDDSRSVWNNNQQWQNNRPYDERDNRDYYQNWNNRDDNDRWNNRPNNQPDYRDNAYRDQNWNNYNGVMSTGRYQSLIEQIRKSSFESSKENVAKVAVRDNQLTVEQMKGIVAEFSFESTKLNFIKSNYQHLVDKKNVYMIFDVFTFQSSKDELTEFLDRQPR